MPDTPFTYEKSSRRPMTWAALIATCGFLVVAWIYAAPWDILALWSLAIVGLAFLIMKNPKYGIRLNAETLTYWTRGPETDLALADIDHVAFRPAQVVLHHRPPAQRPERAHLRRRLPPIDTAIAEFTARGVKTTRE